MSFWHTQQKFCHVMAKRYNTYSYCDYYYEILAQRRDMQFSRSWARKIWPDRNVILLIFMINRKHVFLLGGPLLFGPLQCISLGVRTPRDSTSLVLVWFLCFHSFHPFCACSVLFKMCCGVSVEPFRIKVDLIDWLRRKQLESLMHKTGQRCFEF